MTDEEERAPIRASDAFAWAECRRKAWFALHPPAMEFVRPDRFAELLRERGEAHERAVLARFPDTVLAESPEDTARLMTGPAPVIYQPQFLDEVQGIVGTPDFLIRRDEGWQVADAKLALSLDGKRAIAAQVGVYRQLANSSLPALVFLGDHAAVEVGSDALDAAADYLADMMLLREASSMPDASYAHSRCEGCPYHDLCVPGFEARMDVSLNPAVKAPVREALADVGITTLHQLAEHEPDTLPDISGLRARASKRRAILQARSLLSGRPLALAPLELPSGPQVHFDIENLPPGDGDPARVYLWGLLPPEHEDEDFDPVWAGDGDDGDRLAWLTFVERMARYRESLGDDMRLVHYAPHERSMLRTYAVRFDMETDPTVAWILSEPGPLLDLHKVLKRCLVLPVRSYSLKVVCKHPDLVNFRWRREESGSQWSVVRYQDFLNETDPAEREAIKREILEYNLDDVRATAALWDWLGQFAAPDALPGPGVRGGDEPG